MSNKRKVSIDSYGVQSEKLGPAESAQKFDGSATSFLSRGVVLHSVSVAEMRARRLASTPDRALPAFMKGDTYGFRDGAELLPQQTGRFYDVLVVDAGLRDPQILESVELANGVGFLNGESSGIMDSSSILLGLPFNQFVEQQTAPTLAAKIAAAVSKLTGSWVQIGYADNNFNHPYILGIGTGVAHPSGPAADRDEAKFAGSGGDGYSIHHAPGATQRSRWNGAIQEVDANGNIRVDTALASGAPLSVTGLSPGTLTELANGEDRLPVGEGGNQLHRLRWGQAFKIEFIDDVAHPAPTVTRLSVRQDGLTWTAPAAGTGRGELEDPVASPLVLDVTQVGASPTLRLHRTGTTELAGVVIGENLVNLLNSWKSTLETYLNLVATHTHVVTGGTAANPSEALAASPVLPDPLGPAATPTISSKILLERDGQ